MQNLILVAIGGAIGAVSRYSFVEIITSLNRGSNFPQSFPLGTILVNIIGSFLMGVLHFLFTNYLDTFSPQTRLLLATGVLGGFTTFSAFSADAFRLIAAGQINIALFYILSSVIFSILAMFAGFYLANLFS